MMIPKVKNIKRLQRLIYSSTVSLSLTFSPLVHAESQIEAEKKKAKHLLSFLQPGGRQLTVKEFWTRVRPAMPIQVRAKMDYAVFVDPNAKMPEYKMTTVKGSDGKEHVRLLVSSPGYKNLVTMDLMWNKSEMFKLNGIGISYGDIYHFKRAQKKIAVIPDVVRESASFVKKAAKSPFVIDGYDLAHMTPQTRAQFFINLRFLMADARKVMKEAKDKKFAQLDSNINVDALELLLQKLLGEEALAKSNGGGNSQNRNGELCVNAGWIAAYDDVDGKNVCSYEKAPANLEKIAPPKPVGSNANYNDIFKQTQAQCPGHSSSPMIPCNPLLYGAQRGDANGTPICVDAKPVANAAANVATTDMGECEKQSPLTNKVGQMDYQKVSEQIQSMLKMKYNDAGKAAACQSPFKGVGPAIVAKDSATLEACIYPMIKQFQDYYFVAQKYCVGKDTVPILQDKFQHEPHQVDACAALNKRGLAVNEFWSQLHKDMDDRTKEGAGAAGAKDCSSPCCVNAAISKTEAPSNAEAQSQSCAASGVASGLVTGGDQSAPGFWDTYGMDILKGAGWTLLAGGVVVGVLCGFQVLSFCKDDKDNNTKVASYIPPAPVPGTIDTPTSPTIPKNPGTPTTPDGQINLPPGIITPPAMNEGGTQNDSNVPSVQADPATTRLLKTTK